MRKTLIWTVVVGIVILAAATVLYVSRPQVIATQTTTSSGPSLTPQEQFNIHLTHIRNYTSAIYGDYLDNATLVWTGAMIGTQGAYNGTNSIRLLYDSVLLHVTGLRLSAAPLTLQNGSSRTSIQTMLNMSGTSNVLGRFNGTIHVSMVYARVGGDWKILHETWNYISFNTQFHSSSTVFPQWGLSISGKDPNLAEEHALEWSVAPYLIYALYLVVSGLGLVFLWRRRVTSRDDNQKS